MVEFEVVHGDILEESAQAIVISIGKKYQLGGKVASLLCKLYVGEEGNMKQGVSRWQESIKESIEEIINKNKGDKENKENAPSHLKPGAFILTGAGESEYKYIISKLT